jgi:hypothetical protein
MVFLPVGERYMRLYLHTIWEASRRVKIDGKFLLEE